MYLYGYGDRISPYDWWNRINPSDTWTRIFMPAGTELALLGSNAILISVVINLTIMTAGLEQILTSTSVEWILVNDRIARVNMTTRIEVDLLIFVLILFLNSARFEWTLRIVSKRVENLNLESYSPRILMVCVMGISVIDMTDWFINMFFYVFLRLNIALKIF